MHHRHKWCRQPREAGMATNLYCEKCGSPVAKGQTTHTEWQQCAKALARREARAARYDFREDADYLAEVGW